MKDKLAATHLTDFVDAILRTLPADSRIADEVERTTTLWLAVLAQATKAVKAQDDIPVFDVTSFQNAVAAWQNQKRVAGLSPVNPTDVNNAAVDQSASTAAGLPPTAVPAPSRTVAQHRESPSSVKPKDAPSRQRILWDMATASDPASMLAQRDLLPGTPPFDAPRAGDLVVHDTRYTGDDIPPIWITSAAASPLFTLSFPDLAADAQIWLSFAEPGHATGGKVPQWLRDHPDTQVLWQCWYDLRCWAVLAPEISVFVNEKHEPLDPAREAICKTLLTIHRNFEHALQHPEQKLIGVNLHKVYSAFYQFLRPEDLNANQVEEQGVFALLRKNARSAVRAWLDLLKIKEDHAAGPLIRKEFLAGVQQNTLRNIHLSSTDALLRAIAPPQENQVVYWLKPHWHQTQPPQHGSRELAGSVLYMFD